MSTTETNEVKYYRRQEVHPEEWFRDGFYSAINYLNLWITAAGENHGVELNGDTFKSFIETFVGPNFESGNPVIRGDFFDELEFYEDQFDPNVYPVGTMPNRDPPPDYIEIGDGIKGVPRPGPNERTIQWLNTRRP